MQESKVAIIGAGASGIFCAILLSSFGIRVDIFEKNKIIGRKLLATGNGRCNIHNQNVSAKHYQSSSFSQKEIQSILQSFDFRAFLKYFAKLGIALEVKDNGRVYPLSNSAKALLEVLSDILQNSQNLKIFLETEVLALQKSEVGFTIKSAQEEKNYSFVILSCGSEAASKLGGSDSGLRLAENLGLKILKTYPALVPLKLESNIFKSCSGVKIKANLSLKNGNEVLKSALDDVLLTDYGISGFAVLDISSHIALNEDLKIILDFLPQIEAKALESQLLSLIKAYPNRNPTALLSGFLHPKVSKTLAQNYPLNPKNTKQLKQFIFKLKNFEIKNITLKDFESAEVSGGGVSGEEINLKNMESKRYKNLYIIGEMLDIIGDRGGYNLAFAWASAHICAEAIREKYLQ